MYWEVIRTLETFAKSQGTQRPAITWLGPADLCGGAGSQGVIRVELLELTRLKKIQIWLCSGRSQHRRKNGVCWPYGRVAEHRDNGSCPSCPHSVGIQLSLSLYYSGAPWAAVPSPEWSPRWLPMSEILCTGPLRRHLGFQQPSVSLGRMGSPLIFIARCYLGSYFSYRLWPEEPGVGLRPLLRGHLQLRWPPWFSIATGGCETTPVHPSYQFQRVFYLYP